MRFHRIYPLKKPAGRTMQAWGLWQIVGKKIPELLFGHTPVSFANLARIDEWGKKDVDYCLTGFDMSMFIVKQEFIEKFSPKAA
ncbi:hypothetical protein WCU84_05935 [Dickeya chrysanthemi]|uniref:Uncharacterized protein n=1 Tax=Dickeya chrysanthemi TaxID=556 RepID=A0ABU8JIC9_DICCH